jgi:hypothetical protein
MTILNEGGNIFKTPEGESATTRIMQADVLPTVEWLEGVTNLELTDNMLGTTGKKETSGDLDLAVDVTKMSKAELEAKLTDYVTTNNMQGIPKEWVRKTGISVHFKTPIKGDDSNGFVQTDFMFGNPDWMKFSLQGMKWSANEGLKDRETNELVSNDPNQIAKTLLGQTASPSTLETVESIVNYIKKLPNYDDLVADAVGAFERDGLTLPDNKQVETYQANWMRRMIDSVK